MVRKKDAIALRVPYPPSNPARSIFAGSSGKWKYWNFFFVSFCVSKLVPTWIWISWQVPLTTLCPLQDCGGHCFHFVKAWCSFNMTIFGTNQNLEKQRLSGGIRLSSEIHQNRWEPDWTVLSGIAGLQCSSASQGAWSPAATLHSSPAFNGQHQAASS